MKITTQFIAVVSFATIATAAIIVPTPIRAKSSQHSQVVNPDIPETMELCGQKIDLTREDVFERYDRELTSLAYGHGNTLLTLKRANKFFPVIFKILKEENIPTDVAYLACVESYLSPRAYSSAKAAGIWQFIPSAGKQYGLEVNDEVDERYHLEKATRAACKYLKQAYNKYGDWPTAMASYNGGQGRISSALNSQQADSFFDLYLADETTRYVYRIMAMKTVMENPQAFGYELHPSNFYYPVTCEEIEVSEPVDDWAQWAVDHGTTYAMLREENPWIRAKSLSNKSGKAYTVRVPKSDGVGRKQATHKLFNHKWVM